MSKRTMYRYYFTYKVDGVTYTHNVEASTREIADKRLKSLYVKGVTLDIVSVYAVKM